MCSRRESCAVAAVAPFGSDAATAMGPPTRLIVGALARLLRAPMASATSAASQDPHSAAPAQRGLAVLLSVQDAEVVERAGDVGPVDVGVLDGQRAVDGQRLLE